ncbi:MAG: glycosyltransferase family 39 protein [Pyrinomonadaceae bacterium]
MKEWKKVLLLTLAALVFRAAHCILFRNDLIPGADQIQYIQLGQKFAHGNFYGVLDTYWPPLFPMMIGALTHFIDSLILPSAIIAVVAGSLAVPLTYYLAKQSYGPSVAWIAAGIAFFYPHLINAVLMIGTENVYLLWIVGAVYFGWWGLKKNSAKIFFLTGMLIGLGYLTRPEAFGYLAFFALFAFISDFRKKKVVSRSSLARIGALLLGFIILATPYIVYLRAETGHWTISGKMGINFAGGEFNEEAEEEEIVVESKPIENKSKVTVLFLTFFYSLIVIQKIFAYLLPFLLMVFVVLGLFADTWNKERFKREGYLIVFCMFTVLGYALSASQARYFYILLPIFFGWMACGILYFRDWLEESTKGWIPNKASFLLGVQPFVALSLIFIYVYMLPINSFTHSAEKKWKSRGYEERAAGLWIKENSQRRPLIFSTTMRPAFYSEGKQLFPGKDNLEDLLASLKNDKADYVVFSERALKRRPFLRGLDKALQSDPDFELVYQKNDQPGYGIFVFKRK